MHRCLRILQAWSMYSPASRDRHALAAQGRGDPDERQADERCRVLGFDPFEECNAKRLDLEAAGAIERALTLHVASDLLCGELACHGLREIDMARFAPRARHERHGGVELGDRSGEPGQLGAGARGIAGFVEDRGADRCDLVAADDERPGMAGGYRAGFLEREAAGPVGWRFPGQDGFLDPRRDAGERRAQPSEQLAAIARGGGQDEGWRGQVGINERNNDLGRKSL